MRHRIVLIALLTAFTLAGCVTVRFDVPRVPSQAWPQPQETTLGRAFAEQLSRGGHASGFYVLASGMEAFGMRAGLAGSAERTLDLQYYIVREDVTSQLLLHRVLEAARRGVRVRLLIDDLSVAGNEIHLATLAAHPQVEVRIYNAFFRRGPLALTRVFEFLSDFTRLNRRMHNKLWIADNAAAIVGGRNLGDEYFDAHSDRNFADLDVLAAGAVVRDVSRSFDEYWNSEWTLPAAAFVATAPRPDEVAALGQDLGKRMAAFRDTDYARELRDARPAVRLRSGSVPLIAANGVVVYDEPGKKAIQPAGEAAGPLFSSMLRPLIEAARKEVILISPYFIPSETGVGILRSLAGRGVRVRILTNSLASTDSPVVHAAYARFRPRLIAAGVELYEMRGDETSGPMRGSGVSHSSMGSLHAKAVVVDRHHALVGSMNLDPRSRLHNTEIGLLIESDEIAARIGAFFDEAVQPARVFRVAPAGGDATQIVWITEESGTEIRYAHEPLAPWWRRVLMHVLDTFTPEHLR